MRNSLVLMMLVYLVISCDPIKEDFHISDNYLKCSIEDQNIKIKNNKKSWKSTFANSYGFDDVSYYTNPEARFYNTESGENYFMKFYSRVYDATDESDEKFILNDIFQLENHLFLFWEVDTVYYNNTDYVVSRTAVNPVGVVISLTLDGVYWSSDRSIQPISSNFLIKKTNYKRVNDSNNGDYIRVKGEFNCILFDEFLNEKSVKNAEFKLDFSAF